MIARRKKMRNILFIVFVFFLSAVFLSGQIVPLPEIQKPETIIVDQNQILITEFPHVYIYSLKDTRLIKKFGKAGEGPREFFTYVRIQYDPQNPQYIVVGSHMKMSYFTRKGEFVKEVRSKTSSAANVYKPVGKHYAAYGIQQVDKTVFSTINLHDENLKKIKELVRWENIFQQGKPLNPTDTDMAGGQFRIFENKVFFMHREDGRIEIFDENGEKLKTLSYKYDRVPVTQKDRDAIDEHFKTDPRFRQFYDVFKAQVKYPGYWPSTIDHLVAANRLYILTNKKSGDKSEFVIFDMDGKLLKKVMVPLKFANPRETYPFTINYGKLFQLADNEDTEEWELHVHEVIK
jgi:hypothetical protein